MSLLINHDIFSIFKKGRILTLFTVCALEAQLTNTDVRAKCIDALAVNTWVLVTLVDILKNRNLKKI